MTANKYIAFIGACLMAASLLAQVQPARPQLAEYHNTITANARAVKSGNVIVIGSGQQTRAFSPFGGSNAVAISYAETANEYKRQLGDGVNVYLMPIPIASEFYIPDNVKSWTKPQAPVISDMFAHLSDSVYAVDAYTPLSQHVGEEIYSRTDHHWLPLGAYYAARKFAEVAKVPFKDLSEYDEKVVHRFVGTMYKFSKNIAVKNAPEEFKYYVPRDSNYTTTYVNYKFTGPNRVTGESEPRAGKFFISFPDGSSGTYCTFMGGDAKLTKVVTPTKNGRRLIILKDSFGNAVPGYLFYSFEEIHVIDCRYYTKNIKKYVADNKITDVVFINNLSHVCTNATYTAYKRYLVQ